MHRMVVYITMQLVVLWYGIIVVLPKAVGCGQWPFIPFTLILMSKVQCNCTMTIESV